MEIKASAIPNVTSADDEVPISPKRIEPRELINPNTVPKSPNRGAMAITASKILSPRRIKANSSSAAASRAKRKSSGSGDSNRRGA